MRYQEWDVLLFPEGSNIPIQEFRTASFLVREQSVKTPTLVTYIPSLEQGSPFVLSLHSWTSPQFSPDLTARPSPSSEGLAWGVKVVVDGICVSSSTFSEQASWPQIISASDRVEAKGNLKALPFPPFHRSVLSRRDWHMSDDKGRVKVLLTEGMRVHHDGRIKFQPLNNIICFSFQPAPMDYLRRCNIAWPNPSMLENPWKPDAVDRYMDPAREAQNQDARSSERDRKVSKTAYGQMHGSDDKENAFSRVL
ncbi:hypothetical protein CAC42_6991 [Sphaceloma murrayae]|uniref:Uncharacterized protein n=1 Tax=Sphaceloma murrayae TaxID=2082308 RepID=A0A2K1QQD9_9PEZI|nr:hypothetical protein CAC42_6991 [Sphaceloma murrayae]